MSKSKQTATALTENTTTSKAETQRECHDIDDGLLSAHHNIVELEALRNHLPAAENTQSWIEISSKLLGTMAMVLAVQWFSGPYTAIAAREIYSRLAEKLYGGYRWYDPRYYTLYLPSREHVSHLGYEYGPYILNTFLAPLIYKGVGKLWHLGKKVISALFGNEEASTNNNPEHDLDARLDHLIAQLENLSLHDNTDKTPAPAASLKFSSRHSNTDTSLEASTKQDHSKAPMRVRYS